MTKCSEGKFMSYFYEIAIDCCLTTEVSEVKSINNLQTTSVKTLSIIHSACMIMRVTPLNNDDE